MKKANLLVLLVSILSLASCGNQSLTTSSGNNDSTSSEVSNAVNDDTEALKSVDWSIFKTETSNKIKVTFWVKEGTAKYYTNYETSFESIYKGVDLEITEHGNYQDIDTAIKNGASTSNIPTMALSYPDYTVSYIKNNGLALNMLPYMNNEIEGFGKDDPIINGAQSHSEQSDIIASYLKEGSSYTLDNKLIEGQYTLPFAKSTEFLTINKNQVSEAAEKHGTTYEAYKAKLSTWEGLWEVSEAMQDLDVYKAKTPALQSHVAPFAYEDDTNMFVTLCQQLGIGYVDGTSSNHFLFGTTSKADVNALLKNLNDKFNKGLFMTGDTTGLEGAYVTSMFANQNIGMIISTTAGLSWMVPDYGSSSSTPSFEVEVLPMPSSSTQWVNNTQLSSSSKSNAVISQGPSIVFLNKSDINEKAAGWLFYKFMTNDINCATWTSSGTYAPVRTSVYSNETFNAGFVPNENDDVHNKYLKLAKKDMYDVIKSYSNDDRLYTTDVFVGSSTARLAVGTLLTGAIQIENVTDDKINELIKTAYETSVKASV